MENKTKKMAALSDDRTTKVGRFRRLAFRVLGGGVSRAIIGRALHKKIDNTPAAFPADLARCSEVLVILPKDQLETICQLETIFAITGKYANSNFTFVCPKDNAVLLGGIANSRIVTYDPELFLIYTSEHTRIVKELEFGAFDICIMLERQYTLAHLYLIGISRAHLRVGWGGAETFPFLNIRLVVAENSDKSIWERNFEAAKILGASAANIKARLAEERSPENIAKFFAKYKLSTSRQTVCVDISTLEKECGIGWCEEFFKELRREHTQWQYCVLGGIGDAKSGDGGDAPANDYRVPTLPLMSVESTAAFIAHAALVVAGEGIILGLAHASNCKTVPVMNASRAAFFCKKSQKVMPATFDETPNSETVKTILKNIKTLMTIPAVPAQTNVTSSVNAAPISTRMSDARIIG